MALPLGKIGIIVGAGLIGSVLLNEGRLPSVPDMVSGVFKIGLKQIRRDDSTSSVSKSHNNSLLAQVKMLQKELESLSDNSIIIVNPTQNGGSKYGIIVVIVTVGCGYVWWKGWKLPDMMFATRRSLRDASTAIGKQLENVHASMRNTRRELASNIDRVDSNLNEVSSLTANTQEKVAELLVDSGRFGHDLRHVRDVVETLEHKIYRIEGKQEFTNAGIKKLVGYANKLDNNMLEENNQASPSTPQIAFPSKPPTPQITFSSKEGSLSLPPPSSEPTSPAISDESIEVQRPFHSSPSAASLQTSDGISGATKISSTGISNGISARAETNNGTSSWLKPFLFRTISATSSVLQQAATGKL